MERLPSRTSTTLRSNAQAELEPPVRGASAVAQLNLRPTLTTRWAVLESPVKRFHLGPWLIQPERNRLLKDQAATHLQGRVMDLLVYLAQRAPDVVSKQELAESVWSDVVVSDEALTTAVWELRKALGDSASQPRFIETVRGRGYRSRLLPLPAPEAPKPIAPVPEPIPPDARRLWSTGAARGWLPMGLVTLGWAASLLLLGGQAPHLHPTSSADDLSETNTLLARAEVLGLTAWQWDGAERALTAALDTSPEDPRIHNRLAHLHAIRGDHRGALAHIEQLSTRREAQGPRTASTTRLLYLASRFEEAVVQGRQVLRQNSNSHATREHVALALLALEQPEAALAILEAAPSATHQSTSGPGLGAQALALTRLGRKTDAERLVMRLHAQGNSTFDLALGLAALGKPEAALKAFDEAAQRRSPEAVRLAIDPLWAKMLAQAEAARNPLPDPRHQLGISLTSAS